MYFSRQVKELSFHPNNSKSCLLKLVGDQGKALAFRFSLDDMHKLEETVKWCISRMYTHEKFEYDAEIERAAEAVENEDDDDRPFQTEFNI